MRIVAITATFLMIGSAAYSGDSITKINGKAEKPKSVQWIKCLVCPPQESSEAAFIVDGSHTSQKNINGVNRQVVVDNLMGGSAVTTYSSTFENSKQQQADATDALPVLKRIDNSVRTSSVRK